MYSHVSAAVTVTKVIKYFKASDERAQYFRQRVGEL